MVGDSLLCTSSISPPPTLNGPEPLGEQEVALLLSISISASVKWAQSDLPHTLDVRWSFLSSFSSFLPILLLFVSPCQSIYLGSLYLLSIYVIYLSSIVISLLQSPTLTGHPLPTCHMVVNAHP